MNYEKWADTALANISPEANRDNPISAKEAYALLRAAYIEGYIGRLSGDHEIMDPCSAERHLTLSLPVL